MVKYFLSVICLFLVTGLFAQNTDSLQPDSIYKKLKISKRSSSYQGSGSKSKEIFLFDRSGKIITFILTDNETGYKPQLIHHYLYNNDGLLTGEFDTTYLGNKINVKTALLSYGSNGELIKSVLMTGGNIFSEKTYTTKNEFKETEKLYRGDTVYREQTAYYDNSHKKIRFLGMEYADKNAKPKTLEFNGKKYTFTPDKNDSHWDYHFENTYDTKRNLITQKRLINNVEQDEISFTYDRVGLLKEIVEKRNNVKQVIKIEYEHY